MKETKLHVLVAGDLECHQTLNVLKQLTTKESRINVTVLPDLSFSKEEKQTKRRLFVRDYLTSIKKSQFYSTPRKNGEKFPAAKLSEWEIQDGLKAIASAESSEAVLERMNLVPGNDLHILSDINMLSQARKKYGSFDAAFVLFDYNKLFTAEGASDLIKICATMNKKAKGAIKPFICFKGPFPQLRKKLSRMPLGNIEICFMHPLSGTKIFENMNQIVVVPNSVFERDLERSFEHFQSRGLLISSSRTASASKGFVRLVSSTKTQASVTVFLPALLAWKSNECVKMMDSPLFLEEERINLVKDACSEVGAQHISKVEIIKVEEVLETTFKRNNEPKMNSVRVAAEVSDLRFVLQEMTNASDKSKLQQLILHSECVVNTPTEEFSDPLRDLRIKLLEKFAANRY